MKMGFQVDGAVRLEQVIASMPAKLAKKGIRRAVRAAHRLVYESIVRKIQSLPDSGLLKRRSLKLAMLMSFRRRTPRRQRPGTFAMDAVFEDPEAAGLVYYPAGSSSKVSFSPAGVVRGAESGRAFIPAALEFGHGSDKAAAARPFMRSGVAAVKTVAERTLAAEMARELDALVVQGGGGS
jgi:hypothetical protein